MSMGEQEERMPTLDPQEASMSSMMGTSPMDTYLSCLYRAGLQGWA